MAKKADELVVEIKGDVSDLLRKLDEATGETEKSGKKISGSLSKASGSMSTATKAMGAFGVAVAAGAAAVIAFNEVVDRINSNAGLAKTAKRVGLGVEKFQELSFAARSVGVDAETMADAVKDLNVKITDAAGGAQAYEDALNKIGLSSKELVGLSVDKQFEKFADAMAKASAENRRFVADEINDSMFQLNPLLEQGSEGLKRMAKEARELNAVMSDVDIASMEQASRDINNMKAGFEGLTNELVISLTPSLSKFVSVATDGLKLINTALGLNKSKVEELADKQKELNELQTRIAGIHHWRDKVGLQEEESALLDEILQLQIAIGRAEMASNAEVQKSIELLKARREAAKISKEEDENEEFNKMFSDVLAEGDELNLGNFRGRNSGEEEEEDEEEKKKNLDMGYGVYGPDDFEDLMSRNFEQFAALENQRKEFLDRELNQYKDQIKQTQWLWESGAQGKLRVTKGFFNDLLTITQGRSRKLFEFNKALGIADATISTFKGAAKALELPYPYNLLAMAQVAASGMAQVSKIQSVQFGGGGGGGASSGGASAPASASSEALQSAEQQGPTNVTEATINITGDNISGDSARALVAKLREYQEDGGELIIK